MLTALWVIAVALVVFGFKLNDKLNAIISDVSGRLSNIDNTIRGRDWPPLRAVAAKPGTRIAFFDEEKDALKVKYAPVVAFIEDDPGGTWSELALISSDPNQPLHLSTYLSLDHYMIRVLLPDETLEESEVEMARKAFPNWKQEQLEDSGPSTEANRS